MVGALGSWGDLGRRHSDSHACAHSVKYLAHMPGGWVLLCPGESMDRMLCRLYSRGMHARSAWVSLQIFPAFPGSSCRASEGRVRSASTFPRKGLSLSCHHPPSSALAEQGVHRFIE